MGFLIVMIILIAILGSSSWYIANRLYQGISCFFKKIPFWPVLVGVCIIAFLLILSFGRSSLPLPKEFKHILGIIGGYCMIFFLYLLLFTIAADIIMILLKLVKLSFATTQFFKGVVMICVVIATIITCICGHVNARQIEHVPYNVSIEGKTDISDIKIVMISDLHLGSVGSEGRLENIVEEINNHKPDVVCIAGDFFDTDFNSIQDTDAAIKTLRKIKSTHGVYACLGNHDGGETFSLMTSFLEEAGIRALLDEYIVIDERMVLVGRLDGSPIGGYEGQNRKTVDEILPKDKTNMPVVVMDHNPAHIDEYDNSVDLILCGHTHKGQVFPGNLITKAMYTVDHGYYRKDDKSPHVIVSSGVGTWGVPVRVGTDSEIVTVNFDIE